MGNYLQEPKTEKTCQTHENTDFRVTASAMQGWRRKMEDSYEVAVEIEPDVSVFAVFDGHGGNEIADFCSKHFAEFLKKQESFKSKNYDQALIDTYHFLDEAITNGEYDSEIEKYYFKAAQDDPETKSAKDITWATGCTAVSAIVTKTHIIIANAGDSRAVLAKICEDDETEAEQITTDQKPSMPEEKSRIKNAGGTVEDGRVCGFLAVSRSIGILRFKNNYDLRPTEQIMVATPETYTIERNKNLKFILLATDGIWDCVSN